MKSLITKILFILLFSTVNYFAQVSYSFHVLRNDINLENIIANDGNPYVKLKVDNFSKIADIGKPNLPVKFINLIIPPQKNVSDIIVNFNETMSIPLRNRIFPTQYSIPTGLTDSIYHFVKPDSNIYNSNGPWPKKIVEVVSDGYYDGNNHIVTLKIVPFQYYPLQNNIELITGININLSFTNNNKRIDLPKWRSVKTQEIIDNALKAIVENKSDIPLYQIKPKVSNIYGNDTQHLKKPTPVEFHEYVIITTSALKPYFNDFVAWKKRKGIDIGVVTTSSIFANYTGDYISNLFDDAGKIRQYLRDLREVGGTWVLFAGDYSVLPIRYGCGWDLETWDDIYNNTRNAYRIPTDNYFADWNGNWNVDGDEWIGQPTDDSPDYWPEFYVGRLLCTNGTEISNWVTKQLKYEKNPGNGDNSYLVRSFMMESDQMQAGNQAENIASNLPMFIHTIWRELPSYDAPNPTFPMGYDVINEMNNTKYGLYSWFGHGKPVAVTASSNGINTSPWNSVVPSNASGTDGGLDDLTDYNYPGIVYSISCDNAPFDDYDPHNWGWGNGYNLAEAYTVQSTAGGIAFLGNSRYGWVWGSFNLYLKFTEQINTGNTNLGVAELLSKANYQYHYLEYSHNLIGDPEVKMWTAIPSNFSSVSITDLGNKVIVTVNAPDNKNTICASSTDNGSAYWKVAHNVNSYTFYTSVRPLNITITRTNYLPYLATIGGSLNNSITFSDVTHLFGNFTSETNAKIVIEPNTKIILPDGTSREFESKTVLKGKDINNLYTLVKKGRKTSDANKEIPIEFKIIGNYPNPFNPTTTIKYAIPMESKVIMEIFDINGELINKVTVGEQEAGYHKVVWNGKNENGENVSSGMYIYRLMFISTKTGSIKTLSSKMVLLK